MTKEQFHNDLKANFAELAKLGIAREDANMFLPPYEWYNAQTMAWCKELGLTVINFTPNTGTNADYTTPEMPNYRSSEEILNRLWQYEKSTPEKLNGSFLLIHIGTDSKRKDKLYLRLADLVKMLQEKGYHF